jgi:hypothetical protein
MIRDISDRLLLYLQVLSSIATIMAPATCHNYSNPPDDDQNNNIPQIPPFIDIDDNDDEEGMLDEDEEVAAPTAANRSINQK